MLNLPNKSLSPVRGTRLLIGVLIGLLLGGCNSVPSVLPAAMTEKLATFTKTTVHKTKDNKTVANDTTPNKLKSPALLLIKDQQFDAAEVLLIKEIEHYPGRVTARTNLGLLYASSNRKAEAFAILSDIAQSHPDACPAQVKLGQLHRQAFRFDEAEAAYKTCLAHDSVYAPALRNLGILHELYRGAFDSALTYYERYQAAVVEPDQQVDRWIADLARRLQSGNQIAEVQP